MLARLQAASDKLKGDGGAADALGNQLHLGILLDDCKIVDNPVREGTVREIAGVQNIFQFDRLAGFPGQLFPIHGQNFRNAAANRAEAENCCV